MIVLLKFKTKMVIQQCGSAGLYLNNDTASNIWPLNFEAHFIGK